MDLINRRLLAQSVHLYTLEPDVVGLAVCLQDPDAPSDASGESIAGATNRDRPADGRHTQTLAAPRSAYGWALLEEIQRGNRGERDWIALGCAAPLGLVRSAPKCVEKRVLAVHERWYTAVVTRFAGPFEKAIFQGVFASEVGFPPSPPAQKRESPSKSGTS
jgi:hypothetical protein